MSFQSDPESSDDDIEPKLKYRRLYNDLKKILSQDAISTVKVHAKVSGEEWVPHPDRKSNEISLISVPLPRDAFGTILPV